MKLIFKNDRNFSFKNFNNAVDKSLLRDQIGGIFIDIPNKYLVGTDGHILVQYPIKIVKNNLEEESFRKTIPVSFFETKGLNLGYRDFEEIEYVMFDETLEMRLRDEVLKSMKYITGQFPNYVHTVPTNLTVKHGIDTINIRKKTMLKLMNALPNSDFSMTLFAPSKAILFKEEIIDEDIRPVTGILMPTSPKHLI